MSDKIYYFDDYAVDVRRCVLLRAEEEINVRPKALDVLVYLVENPDRVISKRELLEAVWPDTFVTDASIMQCISHLRHALSDRDGLIIKTVPRRGYMFSSPITTKPPLPNVDQSSPHAPEQDIAFCQTVDGVSLAVASVGNGIPLVKTTTWLNHIEYDWTNRIRSGLTRFLSEHFRYIRYDGRGMGLSDRDLDNIDFEAFVSDLETVADHFGLRKFVILGISMGAATAIAYAVRHPERVSKLIIHGGYALGRNKRATAVERETAEAYRTLLRHGWGDEHSAYLKALSAIFYPKATSEEVQHFAELQRVATSAENAIKLRSACDDIDVIEQLSRVSVPTLVMHSRHDKFVPYEEGRRIASSIPAARLVTLETENHMPLPGEPAWDEFVQQVVTFAS